MVCTRDLKSGDFEVYSAIPIPLTLKNDFPEVKFVAVVWGTLDARAVHKCEKAEYSGFTGASVEPDIFNNFNFKLIRGGTFRPC